MADAYETKLHAEIAEAESLIEHKRVRVDVLREALEMYQKSKPQVRKRRERKQTAASKPSQSSIVLAMLKKAGPKGMTYNELIEGAAADGVTLKRTSLRSLIWTAKEESEIEAIKPGRFRAIVGRNNEPPEAEASSGSESSSRGDNRSRVMSPH